MLSALPSKLYEAQSQATLKEKNEVLLSIRAVPLLKQRRHSATEIIPNEMLE